MIKTHAHTKWKNVESCKKKCETFKKIIKFSDP